MDSKIAGARAKLAKRFGDGGRTGGKGSIRRKRKTVHKNVTTDDKRLQSTLKRLGVNNIPAIEEVNLFKTDGTVIHFVNPKVQASIAANTYVISGTGEQKTLQELLPDIINQLGPDSISSIRKLAESLAPGAGGGASGGAGADDDDDSDDDLPDLVNSNFEDAAAGTD